MHHRSLSNTLLSSYIKDNLHVVQLRGINKITCMGFHIADINQTRLHMNAHPLPLANISYLCMVTLHKMLSWHVQSYEYACMQFDDWFKYVVAIFLGTYIRRYTWLYEQPKDQASYLGAWPLGPLMVSYLTMQFILNSKMLHIIIYNINKHRWYT